MPYLLMGLFATNFGEAWRLAVGADASQKLLSFFSTLPGALQSFWPSLHPMDLLVGLCCGAGLRLAVYLKSKNAKKYRHGMEYGSARWGTHEDIAPYVDPVFQNNVILTKTESLTMSSRPKDPKTARNKNVLVIGGSGSGKTRFWLKPNLMQMHSSYVVTDPKGTILVECGKMLQRGAPKLGKDGKPMKDKNGSVNQQVADISVQVGQTPQGWNGSIFSMIQTLSNSIIVPIAGVILAAVMTIELIQMIADKNNLHDVDTWMIFKWVFKSAAAILIVTNTWSIVMGVFDMAQSVVAQASGIIGADTSIDISSVMGDLEPRLMDMDNYFFAKSLDQVRLGGVVAFVTSRYTMDAKDSTVRRYLAQRAELLGAIRLPNNAFKANAGTEVVSDIIFLQKRDRPLDIIPEWTQTGQTEDGFAINRYFLDHPEMVLGRQEPESTAHGMDYTVNPIEGLELADQLHDAVKYIRGTYQEAALPELGEGEAIDTSIPADPDVKNYSYTVVDGEVYFRENSRMVRPDLNTTADARVKGMVGLRDCVQELIDLQMDASIPDSAIREKQSELNRLYDNFSARYGLVNDRANRLAFADDSSYYLLCALEIIDEEGKLERKADMFTKRTIKPHEAVTSVDTASEALAVSIAEKARVDMAYMEQLTGKTGDELAAELRGVIFRLPGFVPEGERPHYVTADEYLSGNVRRKLRQAQRAAEKDPAFAVNVEALEKAQPKDLDASEIEVRLGATWIDKEYIQQFMYETFNTPFYLQRSIEINYTPYTAEWQVTGKSSVSYNDVAAYTTYGTDRANAYRLLEDALNLRDVRIYDTVEDADGRERRVLNAKETTLAAQKQQAIRDAFRDWIWKDPERRQTLVRQYNEEMNSTRPREYDGSHIRFGGMNPAITLREHQLGAIAHILYGGNTLLAHEVGAGKTFEMVAAAMESKRLGLCQKSLFVVPNHLTEQWASEFLRLYPSANILVTTKKDFETHNRKKFCARIATGDYDAIIIGHSQFERIPISRERQERLLYEQIDEITEGIAEVQASGGERFTVKQLERTRKSLEARLEKLQAEGRKDDVVTFEQLGVDRLFIDEAHNYKRNL